MSQLSNATLTTLSSTYFDDYNESKSFYRILFRPSVAVQARELTQLQTILQKQIQRHGDHVFRDGSVVEGCAITQFSPMPYVRVVDSFLTNPAGFDNVEDLNDTYMITNGTNSNTSVRAKIYTAKKGFQSNYPYTNRIYLRYVFTGKDGSNNDVESFSNGQTLYVYSANQSVLGTLSNTNIVATINTFTTNATANAATGNGYVVAVTDGVIYQKGFFQKVDRQYVIVNELEPNANSALVGFDTVETIVTENQDPSLNDNANGSSNFNAPGAHRLKLTPTLIVKSKTEVANNKNFFPILEFDGNTAVIAKTDSAYDRLGKEIDRRTHEESGDYVVVPHTVETTANVDANVFNYEVSAGISYIKGSRVELIGTRRVQANRANTTQISQNQALTANYGNYVFCDEVVGAMNFDKLGEVALYDTAFTAISDREGVSGGTSGNVVGYANIKSVVYASGTKGTADCQYYVYLFNIRMNKGKSFENDVKSIYATSGSTGYTAFKGDVVLENSKAVLKDSSLTPMLYKTGFNAVKSLTPTGGSLDTTFYYRKTSTGTLNSNGFISVALSGGLSTGGIEQLYSTNGRDYQLVFTQNAYSANLSGTITANTALANSSAANIVGSSTTFQSQLKVGDTIRLSNTGGSAATFKVTAIYSNTLMTVTPNVTVNAVSNTYQRYFQDGHIFNIEDSMLAVNAAANAFTISTGITIASGSGQTMYAQYPVSRTLAVPAAKTVKKNRLVKIDCSNNSANSIGPWVLGLPDVLKINAIYVGSGGSYSNTTANRVEWFTLDNGQKDDVYDLATISVKQAYKANITGSSTILVDLDHLETSTSTGIGHYTIDSYPISANGIVANSTTITIAEIPVYRSKTSSAVYDLRNTIDFRPIKSATANSVANTDPANASITINPGAANTNTYNVSVYGQYHPEVDSVFTADYEYYLPRYDLLILNSEGQLTVSSGVPEVYPKRPLNVSDGSVIAEAFVPPFPSLTTREGEDSRRTDMSTKINLKFNKRYTMKDIGALEERIKRLEYYTVLSTLEKDAKDLTIPDATGRDRFKNGIFADPFNTHLLGSITDAEYKIAIDPQNSVARPNFENHFIDFKYNSSNSTNVTQVGPYVMLPFTDEQFAQQQFATKYRLCTESVWSWKGSIYIAPSQDTFTDEVRAPAINNTIDNSAAADSVKGLKIYGSQSSATSTATNSSSRRVNGGTENSTETVNTTTTSREVTTFDVTYTKQTYNLGTFVKDVATVPYARSIDIAFYATGMKPNSNLHVFFDGVKVDEHVAPGVLAIEPKDFTYDSKEKNIVTTTGPKGITASNPLVANSTGQVAGIFTIPAGKFRTGDRKLLISNVDDLVTGANAMVTKTEAVFTSSGLSVTKQSSTLTTINPEIKPKTTTETNTVVTKSSQTDFIPDPVINDPVDTFTAGNGDGGGGGVDPIAQTFTVPTRGVGVGQYITKMDLYFKQKDPTLGVTLFICTTQNGYPDASRIIGKATLKSSEVNVSDDASVATTFTFLSPVYLSADTEYAFIVQPDADSPDYLIWTAETGGFDIVTQTQVSKNPYDGVMFVSANRRAWTAIQTEDIKFKMYRALFTQTSGTVIFENEDDEYLTLTGVVKANTRSIEVGDVVYRSNSTVANTSTGAPFGIVQYYDELNGKLVLDSTVGGFSNASGSEQIQIHRVQPYNNTSLSYSNTLSDTIIAYANVASVDNNLYHTITPKYAILAPQGTNINFAFKGTDTTYNLDSNYTSIENEGMNELFDKERIVMSRSNELLYTSNVKSTFISATLTSDSPYLSPVIDLRRKSSYFIENIINDDTTNENYTYGNALSKYVSRKVILADGQDAEDLSVYVTATRPINSDIKVYAKIAASDDQENFDTKLWTELEYKQDGSAVYTSTSKVDDYVEYEFGFANIAATTQSFNANTGVNSTGDYITFTTNQFTNNQLVFYYTDVGNTAISGLTNATFYYVVSANSTALSLSATEGGANLAINASATSEIGHYLRGYIPSVPGTAFLNFDNNGVVEYYNNAGSRKTSFKSFAIKIVLTSSDRVNYPRLNDLRAIALQK